MKIVLSLLIVLFVSACASKEYHGETVRLAWQTWDPAGSSVIADLHPAVSIDTNSIVNFCVRSPDWSNVDTATLSILQARNQPNYASYTLNLKMLQQFPGTECIDFSAPIINFAATTGELPGKARQVLLESSGTSSVVLEQFSVTKTQSTRGKVALVFDDGLEGMVPGVEVMLDLNIPGTIFIVPRLLGTDTDNHRFVTAEYIDKVASRGWSIAGHEWGRLDMQSSQVRRQKIAAVFEYLQGKSYEGSAWFAYPNGAYNSAVKQDVMEKFRYASNIHGLAQPTPLVNLGSVNRYSVDRWTTLAQVQEWVKKGTAAGHLVIITFHTLSDSDQQDYNWSLTNFKALLAWINSNQIETVRLTNSML